MKAARITQPNQMEIVNLADPDAGDDEVLIRVRASGICGTDIHIFRGEYLGGYPVIPGHEFSGEVVEVGKSVTRFKPGDRVAVEPNIACDNCYNCLNNRQNFCLNWQAVGVTRPGGMAEYTTAPQKAVFQIGEIPFEEGAFVEPLSCVLHGVQRLSINAADKIAILGAGPIGNLLLQVARIQGASEITVVDKNQARIELAADCGADRCLTCLDDLPTDVFDVVIDATGAIPVMARTLDFVRPGGKILLFGVPPTGKMMSIEPFKIFRKGLTVLASFTSLRNSYQAIQLLNSGKIDVSHLISHRLPIDDFQKGIEIIEKGAENVRKVMIIP
jgi:2-desacetyl-2-hydroxyethyl bacteriochlorophyllide A dehydrogenase